MIANDILVKSPYSKLRKERYASFDSGAGQDFEAGKVVTPFVAGAVVEIIDGPAKGQIGKIIENDDLSQISIVEIVMFERKTPTEIEHKNLRIKN